jgi:hypothetical protein
MVGGIAGNPVIPRTLLEEFAHVRAYPDFSVASNRVLARNGDRFDKLLESFPPEMRSQISEFRKGGLEGDALSRTVSAWEPNDDWHPRSEYFLGAYLLSRLHSR